MRYHKYLGLIVFATLVIFPPMFVYALSTSSPLGGRVSTVPAKAISREKDMCVPNEKNCPAIPGATATNGQWTYSIDEKKTFNLNPDHSPTKGITYYIPRTLRSNVGTLSVAKNILGLFRKETVQIGQCACTYVTDTTPPTTFTNTKTVSLRVSKVTLWGTSQR